jgi:hypothetical protein
MATVHIGIDSGLDGGIVSLSQTGAIIGVHIMPTVKRTLPARKKSKTGKPRNLREIDPLKLLSILDEVCPDRSQAQVTLEECPEHASSVAAMRGMGVGCGIIIACLKIKGFTHHRIVSTDWQPTALGKVPKGETKAFARAAANRLWPTQTWPKKDGENHDGCVDAALISHFGMTKNL